MSANKRVIADAFIELLSRQTLETTTVADILEESGLSRATFYRYFMDKYDVMHYIVRCEVERTVALAPQIKSWDEWLQSLLEHISENKKYYRQIMLYKGQNSFARFLIDYSCKLMLNMLRAESGGAVPKELLFSAEMFTVGCVYMISEWVLSGYKTPAEELAALIGESLPYSLHRYLSPHEE